MPTQEEIDQSYEMTDGIEFDATITDAYFGYDAKYKDGEQLLLILEMETDSGDERQQFYTLGNNFEPVDNGTRIAPINPRKNKFNKRSGLGELLGAVFGLEGDAGKVLKSRGPATDAAIWKGLSFSFAQVTFQGKIKGEDAEWSRLLPTEYLAAGIDGVSVTTAADTQGDGDAILAALKEVAVSSDNYETFVERAMVEVDGVEGSEEWSTKLLDKGFYADLNADDATADATESTDA